MRKTAVALLALAVAIGATPALAQSTLKDVYSSLILLQDANLGIARQMADLEQKAADELEAAMPAIGNPASRAIARTFVTNARTLAAIMLSPMQTYQTAAGESMFVLVRRNIDLLKGITSYRAADAALDQAITRYTILQMQTQDMAEALQNGWTRYGDILDKAQRDGLLASNTFDPATQSWQLGNPVLGVPPPQQNVAAAETPATSPLPMTIAAEPEPEAVPEPQPEPEVVAEVPETPDPPDLASTVTPLEVPIPVPTTRLAEVPNIEDQPAAVEPAAPSEERLTPVGPLDVAETMPVTVQMGNWTVATNPNGEAVATAINLVGDTRTQITSLSMACAPDKSIAYAINGAEQFDAYRVYADRSQNVTVAASSNVILGEDATSMAATLAAAVVWAQQVPDSGRSLTIRTADASGVLALFPPNGYLDARAAIEAACANLGNVPQPEEPELVTALPQDEPLPEVANPEDAVEPVPEEEAPTVAAPIPRPPLDRTRLPALPLQQAPQETTPSQPISLM